MRRRIFIFFVIVSMAIMCSCTKKPDSKEEINNEEVSGYQTVYSNVNVDMNVYNTPLNELVETADIIYKGKLMNVERNIENGIEDGTLYTFKVTESLKGDVDNEMIIKSIGGIMSLSEYNANMKKMGKNEELICEGYEEGKYVFWTAYDKFMLVSPDSEYIIFATKNTHGNNYYFTHLYYGIYQRKEDNKYIRNSDDKDEYREVSEEEIKNVIAKTN